MSLIKSEIISQEKSKIVNDYKAMNIVIAGLPKVGKSTFASQIGADGSVYFCSTEKGLDFLEVYKTEIRAWTEFQKLVTEFCKQTKFKHLVIDVMDNLHDICVDHVCETNKVKALTDLAFGAGFTATKKFIMKELVKLNNAGKGITFVTHTKDKEIKKEAVTYTAVATSLANSIEEKILGMSDLILFCYVDKDGKRMMRTKPTKHIICAGDRSGKLPDVMPMDAKLLLETLSI